MMSLKFRTKTTFAPSGEIWGSVAVSRSNMSIGRKRLDGNSDGFDDELPAEESAERLSFMGVLLDG